MRWPALSKPSGYHRRASRADERRPGRSGWRAPLSLYLSISLSRALERGWLATESGDARPLTKILHRPDGSWQLWPAWGQAPFARIARVTLALVEKIEGAIQLGGRPYDSDLRAEVQKRATGL